MLQSFRRGEDPRTTHTAGKSVADAAVRKTRSSICPRQWGSVGPSRLANQSLSPPVLLRSSWLHRAECRAQSTTPINAVSAEPLQIPAHSLLTHERSKEFQTQTVCTKTLSNLFQCKFKHVSPLKTAVISCLNEFRSFF